LQKFLQKLENLAARLLPKREKPFVMRFTGCKKNCNLKNLLARIIAAARN